MLIPLFIVEPTKQAGYDLHCLTLALTVHNVNSGLDLQGVEEPHYLLCHETAGAQA
jgi:hypothetical protein